MAIDDSNEQNHQNHHIYWWFEALWKMMDFVSWDDDISQYIMKNNIHVPNHQPV